MRCKLIGIAILSSTVLFSGCSQSSDSQPKKTVNKVAKAEANDNNMKETKRQKDNKEWMDITQLEEGTKYDFPTNAKGFIHSEKVAFDKEPKEDSKLIQAGFDKYYYYYLRAMGLNTVLQSVIKVKGVSIEKDFTNLQRLGKIIVQGQYKRTEDIDPKKYDSNKQSANKDWKAPDDRMKKAVKFTQELLNDLDAAINNGGKGDTFGVSYQAGGQKTKELEQFINN